MQFVNSEQVDKPSAEITSEEIEKASKRNIFGLATVGFACCGGSVTLLAAMNVPILGAILGTFGIGTFIMRIFNKFRI